jgi:hypothetical protein
MNYQATKNLPSFSVLSSAWKFLELSWLRVLFLAIAWLFVGSLIFKSGGYNAIEHAIFHGFEFIAISIFQAILSGLTLIFCAGAAFLYFRGGGYRPDPLLDDQAFSDNPSNIYYND